MKGPSLVDNLPIWSQQRRQPTRAELAAKHAADGGGVGSSAPSNSLPDDEPAGTEFELVPLSESSPHIMVRRPKTVAPTPQIKLRTNFK